MYHGLRMAGRCLGEQLAGKDQKLDARIGFKLSNNLFVTSIDHWLAINLQMASCRYSNNGANFFPSKSATEYLEDDIARTQRAINCCRSAGDNLRYLYAWHIIM